MTVLFVSTRAVRARRASTNEALSGLGLSPRSITIASAAPILPWFLVGSIVVCLTAYSLSPRFPIGSARRFEPLLGPGAHIGAIVSVLLITAVLFLAGSVFGGIRDARANSRIPSRNIRFRLVGPAFLCLGSRFARGRARAALGSGVVAALAVAALGVGASAHGLVGAPSLTGSPEDATINESIDDVIDFGDANKLERAELADLRRLEISNALRAVAFKRRADTIVNGLTAPLWGVSDRKGHVPFPIISGRAIHHDGEIALGVALARRLHVRLGDVVNVGERSKRFRVVGLVAATGDMNDAERDGNRTALVSFEDYRRLYPAPNQTSALVRFAPSVPRSRWLATVRQIVPRRRSISVELSLPTRPPKVLALEHLRAPLALGAGALAATAFVGLAQSLSAAVRRRRGALATLSSLGATPRMLSLSVIAESCIVGCLTLVGGTTAGVVIGRRAWHALVDSMGFTTQHVLPVRPIVVGALTFGVMIIVHAALVSQTPSRFRERFAVT